MQTKKVFKRVILTVTALIAIILFFSWASGSLTAARHRHTSFPMHYLKRRWRTTKRIEVI